MKPRIPDVSHPTEPSLPSVSTDAMPAFKASPIQSLGGLTVSASPRVASRLYWALNAGMLALKDHKEIRDAQEHYGDLFILMQSFRDVHDQGSKK